MDLERALVAAKARMDREERAMARKHRRVEWDEYRAAAAALHVAERALAAARNEEHAVPLDFPVTWDMRAPSPQLLVTTVAHS